MDYTYFKGLYENLFDYICADEDRIELSSNVNNIWKSSNAKFLSMLKVYFDNEQSSHLVPSSTLYYSIVEDLETDENAEMLDWLIDYNGQFLEKIALSKKEISNRVNYATCDEDTFSEMLEKLSSECTKLKSKYESRNVQSDEIVKKLTAENIALQSTIHDLETKRNQMETEINHLQDTISNLSSHYCQTFDDEYEKARKRIRTKISKFEVSEIVCV